jgi:nitronate monooxygenase
MKPTVLSIADVATVRHAEKAIAAGADGLILLSAGAGGQTGWANGLAFALAVRAYFDRPLVLAGGIADGHALWAAQALGCTLSYMGTKFIATKESMASDRHKKMLLENRAARAPSQPGLLIDVSSRWAFYSDVKQSN